MTELRLRSPGRLATCPLRNPASWSFPTNSYPQVNRQLLLNAQSRIPMSSLSDSVHHEVSIHLPSSISSRIHMHLTIQASNILLFLTTSTPETSPPATLGSFVYALPAGQKDALPLSTPLYVREETLETATRLAKILVKKTGRPVYVGSSMGFASAGRGGAVEEEMEAVRKVVETVVKLVKEAGEKQDGVESAVKDLKIEA